MYGTDISDIPILDDQEQVDDHVDDLAGDDAQLRRMLEDDSPSDEQLRFVGAGGWLAPPSDRSDCGGIPKGMPTDKVDGHKIEVFRFNDKGGQSLMAEYSIDGLNDQDVREIFDKYKLKDGESRSLQESTMNAIKAMQEVQKLKQSKRKAAALPKAGRTSQHRETATMPEPRKSRVEVAFDFGGLDGVRRARYTDAYVSDSLLVLVADDSLVDSGVWEPPDLGPEVKFEVKISGHPEPLRVFSCGLRHQYGGNMFYLLFLDAS